VRWRVIASTILLMAVTACSTPTPRVILPVVITIYPTRTPRGSDPCLDKLIPLIDQFLTYGTGGKEAIEVSKNCWDKGMEKKISWGILTKDQKVLQSAIGR
jgi:hypothetical protein